MKVTLDGVSRSDKETKFGIKQQVGIKILESTIYDINGDEVAVSDRWLNTFNSGGTENWSKGDEVEIKIIQKGDYLNFKPLNTDGGGAPASPGLEARIKKLEDHCFGGVTVADEPVEDPDNF